MEHNREDCDGHDGTTEDRSSVLERRADEIGVVICYETIYVRDCWEQLTDLPWWYVFAPDVERQLAWRRDVASSLAVDWMTLSSVRPAGDRASLHICTRDDGVYLEDRRSGTAERLVRPAVSGWDERYAHEDRSPAVLPSSGAEVEQAVPLPDGFDAGEFLRSGRGDLAVAWQSEFGDDLFPIGHVSAPFGMTYDVWGFEGMMSMAALRPDLIELACQRLMERTLRQVRTAAALGCAGIWIEDCMSDMISPEAFARLNVPFVRQIVEEIQSHGMAAIHYFCGNPAGKWELLLDTGADALSLEEGKKGFEIDIDDVAEIVAGRCAVLGNLDAISVLQSGSDARLRAEVARQIAAGRRNGSRFVMSIGSPVTPDTPVDRVRQYVDIAHELGSG
ncbi:MAG: hypothetical protein GX620_04815 [Chloroflexi bacterium]|nr:hypothetical protein [Chloroflexota bacterium]